MQIQLILINLLNNAHSAVGAKSGKITITLAECTVDDDLTLSSGVYACLSVSDNGNGIPQHSLKTIFDPYATSQERGRGTGLGLAVVYGIVKEHQGEIKVFTAMGQGTTFEIFLPLSAAKNDANIPQQSTGYKAATARILLVDDNEMVLTMEKQMLERLGYRVTAMLDSIDALETFRLTPHDYELAIVDLDMPRLNGKELAGELKKIRSDIKIVLCTGYSDRIDEQPARSAGIVGFLFKPVNKSYMAEELEKILAQS